MPSMIVTPVQYLAESPAGGPVIGGVTFRRPVARAVTFEPVRSTIELGGSGQLRTYVRGTRRVVELEWSRMTDPEVAALTNVLAPAFVDYADDADSAVYRCSTDEGIEVEAIPGTYPVRYQVSIELRQQDPTR